MSDYNGCTCLIPDPREALAAWRSRAMPIIMRMIQHGHRLDAKRMQRTLDLVVLLERGHPSCFAPENRGCSHHLINCPAAPRNQGCVAKTPREQPVHIRPEAARAWLDSMVAFAGRASA